jgi:HPt (histidine-containing phosphotransfer) domain-containing protein
MCARAIFDVACAQTANPYHGRSPNLLFQSCDRLTLRGAGNEVEGSFLREKPMSRIDVRAIRELREFMGDEFSALIHAFAMDSQAQIDAIDAALAAADGERVRRYAHSMRGACVNLGAHDLADLCERLEASGRAGDCGRAGTLMASLKRELDAVGDELSQYVRH